MRSIRDANIRLQCDAIRHARECGVERIEFGAEDGSRGDVDYFIEYFKAGLAAGGTRPAWPDTVGTLTPEATHWYCSRIVAALARRPADRRAPAQRLRPRHDQRDHGDSCGFKVVSVTANGYGERAGNVKLHEFVVALRVLYGIELPGFKYEKLRELARFMERMSGIPLQQHEPIVGAKVFAHESGIHTQAMLIDHRMYEAVPAEFVGGEHELGLRQAHRASRWSRIPCAATAIAARGRRASSRRTELAHRVTDEVKRLREERAASSKSEETIELYEMAMRRFRSTKTTSWKSRSRSAPPQRLRKPSRVTLSPSKGCRSMASVSS